MNHKKTYQYVLFDWDGTLANTLDIWLTSYQETFADYNLDIAKQTIAEKALGDWNGARNFGISNIERFNELLLGRVARKLPMLDLNDHVIDMLAYLKAQDKQLVIVTSSLREQLVIPFERHGIAHYFSHILGGDDVHHHKPDPEVIFKAMSLLDADPAQTIIVGDSDKDIGAAANAGIDSVLYLPESHKAIYPKTLIDSLHPTYTIDSFLRLQEIV